LNSLLSIPNDFHDAILRNSRKGIAFSAVFYYDGDVLIDAIYLNSKGEGWFEFRTMCIGSARGVSISYPDIAFNGSSQASSLHVEGNE
jgi:hypothetical protein